MLEPITITKLTSKCQTTIPAEIRKFIGVSAGDAISFKIINNKVVIEKSRPIDMQYLKAVESTLTEWLSKEDEEMFKDW